MREEIETPLPLYEYIRDYRLDYKSSYLDVFQQVQIWRNFLSCYKRLNGEIKKCRSFWVLSPMRSMSYVNSRLQNVLAGINTNSFSSESSVNEILRKNMNFPSNS
jgi:hypothetical protein